MLLGSHVVNRRFDSRRIPVAGGLLGACVLCAPLLLACSSGRRADARLTRDAGVQLDGSTVEDSGLPTGDGALPSEDAGVFSEDAGDPRDGGEPAADAGPPDASSCAAACDTPPAPTCISDTVLRTPAPVGTCEAGECDYDVLESDCGGLGCCSDHCCELAPSNSEAVGLLEHVDIDVRLVAPAAFDTGVDCVAGAQIGDCETVVVEDGPDVCVCRARSVQVDAALSVVGPHALAWLAATSVRISGVVSVAGHGSTGGAGEGYEYTSAASGGGSGGSYGTRGGGGVEPWGSELVVPLSGGMRGQNGCNGEPGGGAGGALQITAGESILVTSSGVLDAGGGGGAAGSTYGCRGGAGGGSGGAILLEAPNVSVQGHASANGGGGGGGGSDDYGTGSRGSDATLRWGGSGGDGEDGHGCRLQGYTSGGDGGRGASRTSSAASGQSGDSVSGCLGGRTVVGPGGGGGGVGRIRLNALVRAEGGSYSPSPTEGGLDLV